MLTPDHADKNRKKELERKKAEPETFGANSSAKKPDDWQPNNLNTKPEDVPASTEKKEDVPAPTEKKPGNKKPATSKEK